MAEKGRGAGALRRSFGGGHRIVLVMHLRRTVTDEAALLLVELRSKTVAGRRLFQTANRDETGTEAFCAEYKYGFETKIESDSAPVGALTNFDSGVAQTGSWLGPIEVNRPSQP